MFQLSERRRKREQGRRVKLFFSHQSLDGLTRAVFVDQLSQGSILWDCEELSICRPHFWPQQSGRDIHTYMPHICPHHSLHHGSVYFSDLTALAKSMWQRGRKSEQLCVMCSSHFWLDVFVLSQVTWGIMFTKKNAPKLELYDSVNFQKVKACR